MKRLIFPRTKRFPTGDGKRLVKSFSRLGYDVLQFDAEDAWNEYSEVCCAAGWYPLALSDDDLDEQCAHLIEIGCLEEEK